MRIVILDSFAADQGEPGWWDGLRALGEVTIYPRTRDDEVVTRCEGADAVLTNKVELPAAALAALPALRYIGVMATGTNMIDVQAAAARGVAVTNVPGYATDAVAQLVFALVLHFTHDVAGHDADVKAGRWAASPDFCFFRRPLPELAGKTLAIVGSGNIGSAVARIGAAFGMTILRVAVPGSKSRGGSGADARLALAEALPRADVMSLHCPLTPDTRGLVNAQFLAAMKPRALLVNTGRGPLIDEQALVAALQQGRLGGVGLDVLSAEPPPADHPLTDPRAAWARRVVVTPHIGWGTVEARRRLEAAVAANLAAFVAGTAANRVV